MNHKFVEYIPKEIEENILYVSTRFKTVVHKCPCECKEKIVTPLSPAAWELTFNGETISLYPSIGNWKLTCKSHYWIKNNEVEWSYNFSEKNMKQVDEQDKYDREAYLQNKVEHKNYDKKKTIWDFFKWK
ncbi:DUF6527 family protein [Brumimicrobium mesophilum]|uniref:DUF6527 family protein n=1 Tax=Brumimicrobium mesophilum TaxID=392717 RepID=UPI001F3FF49A|nr:DUF6527 family protein [Brumimicrobium mesophilum]